MASVQHIQIASVSTFALLGSLLIQTKVPSTQEQRRLQVTKFSGYSVGGGAVHVPG